MSVQSTQHGLDQHYLSFVLAVLLGIGWLNVPGDLTSADHANTVVKVGTQGVAKIQPDDPWSRYPFDSRELWKFRLTTRR